MEKVPLNKEGDTCQPDFVAGWARDAEAASAVLRLEAYAGRVRLGSLLAGMLIGSFGTAGNAAGLMMLSIGILSLLLSFIVFASIQPSYADVFPITDPTSTEPEQH